jgi:ligand-binding SRPBCC domain-containing protein
VTIQTGARRVREVIFLSPPPEQVFWFVLHPDNVPKYDPSFVYWKPEEYPPRVGTLNHMKVRMFGLSMTAVSEFVEWDPPTRVVVEAVRPTWPVRLRVAHTYEPHEGGTLFTYQADIRAGLGGTLFGWLVEIALRRAILVGAPRLRELLG